MMLEITVSTLCCLHPVFLSHVLVFSVQGYLRTVFFLLLFAEFTIAWQSYMCSLLCETARIGSICTRSPISATCAFIRGIYQDVVASIHRASIYYLGQ